MATRTISTKLAIEGEAQYRQALSSCNAELKTLKSSLALAESEYKNNANSMEALTAKGKALSDMQAEQAKKVSLLESALKNAQSHQQAYADAAADAGKKVAQYAAELEKLKSSTGDTQQEQAQLTAEIEKWTKVQQEAEAASAAAVKGVQSWQQQLNSAKIEQNSLSEAAQKNSQYLEEAAASADGCAKSIDQYGKEVKEAEKDTDAFSDKLKNGLAAGAKAAGVAFAAVGTAAVAGAKFLNDLAVSTEEYRAAQGKLNTAFEAAGYSTETAKEAYGTLFSILGDTDNATEAAQLLAQLAKSEEDVAKWGDIAAGVTGTFGDALPINSLIEASNETAKVGTVTGALADALNWVSISEDEFNEKLAACADEAERTDLITKTLSETYQAASDIFKENNATLLEANKAQAELNDTMARLGGTVAEIKAELTAEFVPLLADVTDAFINLADGADGSEEEFSKAIDALIGHAAERLPELLEFGTDIILNVLGGITNAAPQLSEGAVAVITSLTEGIIEAIPQLAEAASELIGGLVQGIADAAPELIPAAAAAAVQFVQAVIDNALLLKDAALHLIEGLADGVLEAIPVLLEAAPEVIEGLLSTWLGEIPKIAQTGVKLLGSLVEHLPEIIQTIVSVLPEIITSISGALLEKIPEIAGAGEELLTALINNLPQIIADIVLAMPEIIASMTKALADGISAFEDIGENLVRGLWDGIQSLSGWLWDQVSGWISSIWNGITDFFDIASPSKKMAWVGEMLVEGLAGAVDKNGGKAVDAVGKMALGMLSELEPYADNARTIGENNIQGLIDGTVSMKRKLTAEYAEMGRSAIDAYKREVDQHSPSKEFQKIGSNDIKGIIEGAGGEKESLVAAYSDVAKAAVDSVEKALPSDVLTQSLQQSKKACEDLLRTIGGQRYEVTSAAASMRELLAVEEKSAAQKEIISRRVDELNEAVPELGLAYDSVSDSINMTGDALERLVEKSAEQQEYEARVSRLSELYIEQEKISLELEAAREALSQAEEAGAESDQILQESVSQLTTAQEENAVQIRDLESATGDYGDRQGEAAAKVEQMTTRLGELTTEVDNLYTAYEDIRKKAADSMESQLGLFKDLDANAEISIDSLIDSLRGQVDYMLTYANNIKRAMEMGIDNGLLSKLSDGRKESAQILAAIVQGGQRDIDALNEQFAKVELGKEYFAKTVADMEVEFRSKMGELVNDLNDALNEMDLQEEMYTIGMNNLIGLINGADSQREELVKQYTEMGKVAAEAYKREVDQHSPSKKFMQMGSNDIQGIIEGVEREKASLAAAYEDSAQAALRSMERAMPSTFRVPQAVDNRTAAPADTVSNRWEDVPPIQIHVDRMEVRKEGDAQRVAQELYYLTARELRSRGGGML